MSNRSLPSRLAARKTASRDHGERFTLAVLNTALFFALTLAANAQPPPPPADPEVEWICPMDKDIRSNGPGFCPRCGMKLVPGIPEAIEFPVQIIPYPRVLKPGQDTQLDFRIFDPRTGKQVRDFEIVHDKFFHLFVVSQDTTFFAH